MPMMQQSPNQNFGNQSDMKQPQPLQQGPNMQAQPRGMQPQQQMQPQLQPLQQQQRGNFPFFNSPQQQNFPPNANFGMINPTLQSPGVNTVTNPQPQFVENVRK